MTGLILSWTLERKLDQEEERWPNCRKDKFGMFGFFFFKFGSFIRVSNCVPGGEYREEGAHVWI